MNVKELNFYDDDMSDSLIGSFMALWYISAKRHSESFCLRVLDKFLCYLKLRKKLQIGYTCNFNYFCVSFQLIPTNIKPLFVKIDKNDGVSITKLFHYREIKPSIFFDILQLNIKEHLWEGDIKKIASKIIDEISVEVLK